MGKLPAILLYDGDWLKDSVSGCSLSAQGLWLRMMFLGHNSERYGYLCQNGAPIPSESIARRCGCTPEQYTTLLAELDDAGVPSRTPEGIIFSRRMVRDAQERELARKRKEKERKAKKESQSSHADVTPLSVYVNEDVRVLSSKKQNPQESPPDNSDLTIQAIANAHPKLAKPFETERAIAEQLDRLGDQMGVNSALRYLLDKTQKYREEWEKWPKEKQEFSPESPRWFASGCYEEPEKNWADKAAGPCAVDENGGHFEGNVYVTKDGKRMPGYMPPPKARVKGVH
jgi:hypothetical protein